MFSVELSSDRPTGATPYYTLVVRDPYIVGSYHSCDIPLQVAGIPDQHVALVVMRESQANRIADGIEEGAAEAAHIDWVRSHVTQLMDTPVARDARGRYAVREDDPLVIFLTVLPPQDENDEEAAARTAQCTVRVGDVEVPAGSGTIVYDTSEVHIGDDVSLIFRYRPLVVSLQPDDFSLDEIADLLYVYLQLGATVCPLLGGPAADLSALPKPIGLLHTADVLRNTPDCLLALAAGYSVVKTSYVPEWFAVVAQSAASPLSVLPPPSRFSVPLHRDANHFSASDPFSGIYLRPESDNCPFSLYPIPSSAMRPRQRAALFAGTNFLLYSPEAAAQYEAAICAAGGACYVHPAQTAEAREAVVNAGPEGPALYIILGTEAELAAAGANADEVASELSDLLQFLRGGGASSAARTIDILPGATVFEALLTNEFGDSAHRASPPPALASRTVSASTTAASPSVPPAARGAYAVQPHEPIQAREDVLDEKARYQAPYGGAFSEERAPPAAAQVNESAMSEEPMDESAVAAAVDVYRTGPVHEDDGHDNDGTAATGEEAMTPPPQPAHEEAAEEPARKMVLPLELDNLTQSAAAHESTGRGSGLSPRSQNGGVHTEGNPSESRSARGRRRSSLLPHDANRTPTRSQMRSLVRARASSVNSATGSGGEEGAMAAGPHGERRGSMASTTTNGTRGRRRLVSVPTEKPESFADRFDALRLRIYAFLTKEDPALDKQLVSMQRNRYVDDGIMEHALEVKAQAQDFMEMSDDLLIDSTGPYTDALRRYWSDCADIDAKAQRLLSGHRRQSNPASYRRPSFLADDDDAESQPNRLGAPMPHARSPRGGVPAGEGRRRSMASLTPHEGAGSRATTPRGTTRREGYQSIAHNRVEDEHIDALAVAPTTEPALLPPTPRTAAMQRAYGNAPPIHTGASAPLTVTTRRRASSPPTMAHAEEAEADVSAIPASTMAASERPSVPPVDMTSLDGSQRRRARPHRNERTHTPRGGASPRDPADGGALSRQYRPSTPRQRTVGLEAPMRVRARSSSARRVTGDRPAPETTKPAPASIQRAPAPMTSERNGHAEASASKARKRSAAPGSRSGTPRGRYSPRPSTTKRPAWQY